MANGFLHQCLRRATFILNYVVATVEDFLQPCPAVCLMSDLHFEFSVEVNWERK